ncbi:thioredoxin domain-containing protein [Streptomyces viridosporus]|uniref:thioredoxin family protein n=1 Tax=Streptomyces viridosporus TaxID=67581 RepID=UPI00343D9B96
MSSDLIKSVDESSFDTEVLKAQVPVLVAFGAIWCGPCKQMEPILEDIAATYEGKAAVVRVDIDESPNTTRKYGIKSVPTHLVFRQGQKAGAQQGVTSKDTLVNLLDPLS